MNKKCPHCGSSATKYIGIRSGHQRYYCHQCKCSFTSTNKPPPNQIWHDYLINKQSINRLALRYSISESSVKRILRQVRVEWNPAIHLLGGVVQMNITYFGRNHGVLVAIDAATGCLYIGSYVDSEKATNYAHAISTICSNGYKIYGVVIEGNKGLFPLLREYKIQMCQFHLRAIIRRKLTKTPQLEASIELIMKSLTTSDRQSFKFYLTNG